METQTWNICPRKALSSIKPTLGKPFWEPGWDFRDLWDHAVETRRQEVLKRKQDVKKATKAPIKWVWGKKNKGGGAEGVNLCKGFSLCLKN